QLHLNQHRQLLVERGSSAIESLRNFERINGIDCIKELGGAVGLVRLQWPDEMEAGIAESSQMLGLLLKLLHAVFAKEPLPRRVGLQNDVDRMDLAYGHQRDFVLRALASLA